MRTHGKLGLLVGLAAMLATGLPNAAHADGPRHGGHNRGGYHGGGYYGGYHGGGYYRGGYGHYHGGGGWAPVALVGGLAAGLIIADSARTHYVSPRYGYVAQPPVPRNVPSCNMVNRTEDVDGYPVKMAATMCYDEEGVPYIVQGSEFAMEEERVADQGQEDLGQALEKECHVALTGVWFDFNKATLKPESDRALERVLDLLRQDPELTLEVQGHTDSIGTDAYNEALSQDRADAVVAWLVRRGVGDRRLTARGYGETMPVADNGSDSGRAQNRRVEIVNPECTP
jgi:outer membrane protein OmpA-like peptidoglycan-associated protein